MGRNIEAYAAKSQGSELAPWSYETDELGSFGCIVQVEACGLCRSDLHMIDNDWMQSRYPLVPGHEVVGEVQQVGSEVKHLSEGDRVGVGWQQSACLTCDNCVTGSENLCADKDELIVDGYGGFAEAVQLDSRFAFPLPDGIETRHAGPLLCGGITVYNGLMHAGMRSGQEVGVVGIGGLGHLAIQFAAAAGNTVHAFTTTEQKADLAMDLGASNVIVDDGDPEHGDMPEGRLDILLNTAPANLDWTTYLQTLGTDGVACTVAAPGEPLEIRADLLMFGRRRLMGSIIGGRGEIQQMLRDADRWGVRPMIEEFAMENVNEAITKLRDNDVRFRAVCRR